MGPEQEDRVANSKQALNDQTGNLSNKIKTYHVQLNNDKSDKAKRTAPLNRILIIK